MVQLGGLVGWEAMVVLLLIQAALMATVGLEGMAEPQALAGTEVMAPLAMQRRPMAGMVEMVVMQELRVQQAQAERPEGLAPLLVLPVQWVPRSQELPATAGMAVLV